SSAQPPPGPPVPPYPTLFRSPARGRQPRSNPLRIRPRRLRATPALRAMAAETRLHPRSLMLPMFVHEGGEPRPIAAMPGVVQHSLGSARAAAREAAAAGIGGLVLVGGPS